MKIAMLAGLLAGVVATGMLAAQGTPAPITLTSPSIQDGQSMPVEFTVDGRNVSPALRWSGVPAGTKELVLLMTDEDHVWAVPSPVPLVQWAIYGMKPGVKELAEGMPTQESLSAPPELVGSFQGHTSFDVMGYRGPQPPPGAPHRYRFRILALDRALDLPPATPASQIWQAVQGRIIGEGSLTVTYARAVKPARKPVV